VTASQAAASWASQRLGSLGPLGGSLAGASEPPSSFALGTGASLGSASLGAGGGDLLGKLTASQFDAFGGPEGSAARGEPGGPGCLVGAHAGP
jgi:hypothetical protein